MNNTKRKQSLDEISRNIRQHDQCRIAFSCIPGCFGGVDNFACGGYTLDDEMYLWRTEFDSLPEEEKERINRVMYGIAGEIIEETPELLAAKLAELDNVIGCLPERKKIAYGMAVEQDTEDYITSDEYKLMFLRSTNFDVIEAAHKLVNLFQIKQEIFGSEKLAKRITIEDLDEDDLHCLRCGAGTFCGTDAAGRTIIFQRQQFYRFREPNNLVRAMYYVRMSKLESDVEFQRRGLVAILYNVGTYPLDNRNSNKSAMKPVGKLHEFLPIKAVALHHCHENFIEKQVVKVLLNFLPKRLRMVYHRITGSDQACLFELMTYGIPVEKLNHAGWYPIGTDNARDDLSQLFGPTFLSQDECREL